MWCARYRRLLVPYIECELGERERAKVEAHLSRCPSCAGEAELIKSVSGALRASETPAMEPAPDLWAKVSARIERKTPSAAPRPWLRVTPAASACAAAVLVAAVGIGLMRANMPAEVPSVQPAVTRVDRGDATEVKPATSSVRVAQYKHTIRNAGSISNGAPVRPKSPQPLHRFRQIARVPGKQAVPLPPPPAAGVVVAKADGPAAVGEPVTLTAESAGLAKRASSSLTGNDAYGVTLTGDFADEVPTTAPAPAIVAVPEEAAANDGTVPAGTSSLGRDLTSPGRKDTMHWRYDALAAKPATRGVASRAAGDNKSESVVDELNKTEGVHIAALFRYP